MAPVEQASQLRSLQSPCRGSAFPVGGPGHSVVGAGDPLVHPPSPSGPRVL